MTSSTSLDLLPPRTNARITAVRWEALAPEEAKRLRTLGIDVGAEVSVAHRGILAGRDPLALVIGRMTIALRRVHALAMTVEPLDAVEAVSPAPPEARADPSPAVAALRA